MASLRRLPRLESRESLELAPRPSMGSAPALTPQQNKRCRSQCGPQLESRYEPILQILEILVILVSQLLLLFRPKRSDSIVVDMLDHELPLLT